MARRATFGGQCGRATPRARRGIEVVSDIEVREAVRRVLAAELRHVDTAFLHGRPHLRAVIPHAGGEFGEAHVMPGTAQIRTDALAFAGHGMADGAVALTEQLLAGGGRARYDLSGVAAGIACGAADVGGDVEQLLALERRPCDPARPHRLGPRWTLVPTRRRHPHG